MSSLLIDCFNLRYNHWDPIFIAGKSLFAIFSRRQRRGKATAPWASQRPTGTQKHPERPGRRTMHESIEETALNLAKGYRYSVLQKKAKANHGWGSSAPSPSQAYFWRAADASRRSDFICVEPPHYLPTYQLTCLPTQEQCCTSDESYHCTGRST